MIEILAVSDSHIPTRARAYPGPFLKTLADRKTGGKGKPILIHAGDHVNRESLRVLSELADVRAIRGNMDDPEVRGRLPRELILEIGGKRIGVVHGTGGPQGLGIRLLREFGQPVDMLVFGHSHQPENATHQGTILFNPGSISGNFDGTRSYGKIIIDRDIRGEIVWL